MAVLGKTDTRTLLYSINAPKALTYGAELFEEGVIETYTTRLYTDNTTEQRTWRAVIYTTKPYFSELRPDVLVAVSEPIVYSGGPMEHVFNFTPQALTPGKYQIGFTVDANRTTRALRYRSSSETDSYEIAAPGGIPPAVVSTTWLDYECEGYVTYTPVSGTVSGNMKIYDGSGFVPKPVKVWNGTEWVTAPVKRWDGSNWVETNY
ncbi:hypothetical protein [Rhodococcus pyridinivorans]|uniref:hypothetical protein n=1 Tax=Rhodococcus pyridinivorans TaxID=103816 RepID=UPI00128F24D6|nr:hypothetical protein [Rhodococcus pyridinivorans]